MVKTKWTRRENFRESAGDAIGEDITKRETRQTPLEKSNLEQRANSVEMPTTKPAEDAENTSKERTPRKRRTRSSTLMDLSNAAREMARAITAGDVERDIVDITDGWETPVPRRKPKREKEPTPLMVNFGREIRAEVDYVAAMQRVRILPSASLDNKKLKRLGIRESVNHCLRRMEMNEFVRKIGKTYEGPTREYLSTVVLKYPSTPTTDATAGILEFTFQGDPYKIKVTEICNLFGFPHDREISYERTTRHHAKWVDITGEKFIGGRCKAARIQQNAFASLERDQISTIMDYNKTAHQEGESGESEDEREEQKEDATRFKRLEKTTEELKPTMMRMEKAFVKFTSCQQQATSTSKSLAKRKKATPKRKTKAHELPLEDIPTYSSSSSTN